MFEILNYWTGQNDPIGVEYPLRTEARPDLHPSFGQGRAVHVGVDGLTGQKDTYTSLLHRCICTAIKMRSEGIKPGDIITICTSNHLNTCVPVIATFFLGAKVANLDATISLSDTAYLLKQVKPKMIFVADDAIKLIEGALTESKLNSKIVTFGTSSDYLHFTEFLKKSSVEEESLKPVEVDSKDTAAILFSSGTTGLPKGICLSHYGILAQSSTLCDIGYNTNVFLAFSSLYWISSILILTSSILTGGCRVIAPKYDPSTVWNLLEKYKVTAMFLAPIQSFSLYKSGRPEGINTTKFEHLLIGGGYVSREQMNEIRDILPGTNVMLGYGLTEICGIALLFWPNNPKDMIMACERCGSSGRPLPGFSYKVVDPDSRKPLGPNQRGELLIKTDSQMHGYFNLDSCEAWDSDGWLKTGDVVYYDEDYCFYIIDRVKEMLKFQSWHVPPATIESILLTHPAVEAAVVVGLPHPIDGDHPLAAVVTKASCAVSETEIEDYIAKRVHDRMRLRGGVKFVSSIPLTPSGKIKRRDIRDMIVKGHL
ncbi:hypothetical protein ILUMI_12887 [Ignelater luminosus]|uniref:Luciferin 4-monooxygenase n=1 Tax=Ignelater luminosus TaxID=2038154 RepID=A0A8K0CXA0_IGNLU|nr:hypothetical protein ILUMI_12887 [Ignelater luminosus]